MRTVDKVRTTTSEAGEMSRECGWPVGMAQVLTSSEILTRSGILSLQLVTALITVMMEEVISDACCVRLLSFLESKIFQFLMNQF